MCPHVHQANPHPDRVLPHRCLILGKDLVEMVLCISMVTVPTWSCSGPRSFPGRKLQSPAGVSWEPERREQSSASL